MEIDHAANALKELGHSTRLTIFKLLVKAGPEGLPVGEIQAQLEYSKLDAFAPYIKAGLSKFD